MEYNHCFFLTFQCNLFPKNQQQTERFLLPWAGLFKAGLCISQFPLLPTPPPPSRADPRALAFCLPWMANSREWGLLSCQIPRMGTKKEGNASSSVNTATFFIDGTVEYCHFKYFNVRFFGFS